VKMSLVIEVDSLEELDRVAKRLIPLAPVTPSTPVAPPVASPTALSDAEAIAQAARAVKQAVGITAPTFPIAQRVEDDTAHHERVQAATKAVVAEHGATLAKLAGPTPAAMEEAVKSYGKREGFPAARKLLDEYTPGKVGDVPAEKRAELYARLTA
jgi:hypothetical protein